MTTRASSTQAPGFSLLETVVAIAVLSFGVLALAAVYTQGVTYMGSAQLDYIAQQKAAEAIETVFTARDTKVLTWNQIRNGDGAPGNGVFLIGPQPLLDPGPDGLVGTRDDDANNPDRIVVGPGPDKILGTSDDEVLTLNFMTREIQIADLAPNLRQVTVIMRFQVGKVQRQLNLVSYISAFA